MTRSCKLFVLLIFLFIASDKSAFAQKRSDLAPEMIIEEFIGKIGGGKWLSLKSRKEYAYVTYEEDRNSVIPVKSHDRIRINVHPGTSMEVHKVFGSLRSIFVYKAGCNWYYSGRSSLLKFFGPEPITFEKTFPRTELMEALNLEPMKKVYREDTLYRVDFKDTRQLDGRQSLFFGVNSGLLYQRKYTSKNGVQWEYHFSRYTELQGLSEPHQITLTSNGENFFTIAVKSIQYNIEIDSSVFNPPIPCKNENDFTHLEFPYKLDIN